jgi:hypothetical protein
MFFPFEGKIKLLKKQFSEEIITPLICEVIEDLETLENVSEKDNEFLKLIEQYEIQKLQKEDDVSKVAFYLYRFITDYLWKGKEVAKVNFLKDIVDTKFWKFVNIEQIIRPINIIFYKSYSFEDIKTIYENYIFPKILNKDSEQRILNYLWLSQIIWNIRKFFVAQEWWSFFDILKEHYQMLLENKLLEELLTLNFVANHIFMNISQTQEEFEKISKNFDKPLSKLIKEEFGKNKKVLNLKQKKEIKVGFMWERLVNNTPTKYFYSLIKALTENPYIEIDGNIYRLKFYLYDICMVEKSESRTSWIEKFISLGVKYFNAHLALSKDEIKKQFLYSRLKKALTLKKQIEKDGIDILLIGNSNPFYTFIAASRSAPIQVFWSHGNYAWDVEGIDFRLTLGGRKGKLNYKNFSFDVFTRTLDFGFLNPPINYQMVKKLKAQFPLDKIILGYIGRLVKIDSIPYLKLIAELLNKYPNTIYVAFGSGNTEGIVKKAKSLNIPEDRFFLPGWIDGHLAGHVIDIFLDVIPIQYGTSLLEAQAKGIPVISITPREVVKEIFEKKDELIIECYKKFQYLLKQYSFLYEGYIPDIETYKKIVELLIKNERLRKQYGELSRKCIETYIFKNKQKMVKEFKYFLREYLKKLGTF